MDGMVPELATPSPLARNAKTRLRCCKCWRERIPPKWLLIVSTIFVQVAYGLDGPIVRKFATYENADPLVFSFYRNIFSIPVLFFCAFIAEGCIKLPRPFIPMVPLLILLGGLGILGGQVLYIYGVYWTGPNIAGAFQPAIPVWTALLAFVTCTDKWASPVFLHTWLKILGIILSVGGAVEVPLTGGSIQSNDSCSSNSSFICLHITSSAWGYVCLTGQTVFSSIYILTQKRYIFGANKSTLKDYPVYITAYIMLFGTCFISIPMIYFLATHQYSKFMLPGNTLYALVYNIFVVSTLCYLLHSWGNLHLPSTILAVFSPAQVLVSVVSSHFLTDDRFMTLQYIGAVMLVGGLLFVVLSDYMDDRVFRRKQAVRLDCCCHHQPSERSPLCTN